MSGSRDRRTIEVYNSVGGGAFFQRLLNEWKKSGAEVIPFQTLSEADYRAPRGSMGRITLRWRMYAGYAWTCWRGARRGRKRPAIRVVTTNPFFAPALVARATSGNGATVNLLYDLFPEALVLAGNLRPDSWLACRCAAATRFALRECAVTVFLGERLRSHAEAAHGPARRAAVIPVGADGSPFRNYYPTRLATGLPPRILYSGQMGRMHDIGTLALLWKGSKSNGVTWTFQAGGAGYAELRRSAVGVGEVRWGGALPELKWQEAMREAQVALITIAPGAERVVMPSKTYSALVAGLALLAICPRQSDLADLILRHDCGWVVEPGDVAGLRHALAQIAERPEELWAKRRHSFEAGHRYYDMTPVAKIWMKLFHELDGGGDIGGPA